MGAKKEIEKLKGKRFVSKLDVVCVSLLIGNIYEKNEKAGRLQNRIIKFFFEAATGLTALPASSRVGYSKLLLIVSPHPHHTL